MCPIQVSCTLFNAWMRGWRPVRVPGYKRLMAGALPYRPRGLGSARVRSRGPLPRYQDARLGESAVHAALLCEIWIDLAHATGLSAGAPPRCTRLLGPIQDGRLTGAISQRDGTLREGCGPQPLAWWRTHTGCGTRPRYRGWPLYWHGLLGAGLEHAPDVAADGPRDAL